MQYNLINRDILSSVGYHNLPPKVLSNYIQTVEPTLSEYIKIGVETVLREMIDNQLISISPQARPDEIVNRIADIAYRAYAAKHHAVHLMLEIGDNIPDIITGIANSTSVIKGFKNGELSKKAYQSTDTIVTKQAKEEKDKRDEQISQLKKRSQVEE